MMRRVLILALGVGVTGSVSAPGIVAQGPGTPSVEGRITSLDPRFDRLFPPGARLEVVAEGHEWVEGPLWDRATGCLLFSDIPRNAVYRWCEASGVSLFLSPSGYTGSAPFSGGEPGSNGLAWDVHGRLLLAEHGDRRVSRLEPDGRKTTVVDRYQGRRINSPNDVVLAPDGSLFFTDPPWGLAKWWDDPSREVPVCGVYRLSPNGVLTLVTGDFQAPNGIAISNDGRRLIVSESKPDLAAWYVLDLGQDGTAVGRRRLVDGLPWSRNREGVPDGLKLDRDGHVFGGGPGGVYVIHADGTLLGVVETGSATSNAAWGEDGTVLYITAGTRIMRIRTATRGQGW
jgi:gluconolactonase